MNKDIIHTDVKSARQSNNGRRAKAPFKTVRQIVEVHALKPHPLLDGLLQYSDRRPGLGYRHSFEPDRLRDLFLRHTMVSAVYIHQSPYVVAHWDAVLLARVYKLKTICVAVVDWADEDILDLMYLHVSLQSVAVPMRTVMKTRHRLNQLLIKAKSRLLSPPLEKQMMNFHPTSSAYAVSGRRRQPGTSQQNIADVERVVTKYLVEKHDAET